MARASLAVAFILTAVAVSHASPTKVSTGLNTTCVLDAGSVYCWGDNSFGQLGQGFAGGTETTPQLVLANAIDVSVAPSDEAVCAVLDYAVVPSGGVMCWGHNDRGQLGDGTQTDRYVPTLVVNSPHPTYPFVNVAIGGKHACGLNAPGVNHGIVCWGDNRHGEMGQGVVNDTIYGLISPIAWSNSFEISAGEDFTCVRMNNGFNQVFCWGRNDKGQLGRGDTIDKAVINNSIGNGMLGNNANPPLSVSAGRDHTCAVLGGTSAGQAFCWGNNADGEVGDGTTDQRLTPVPVAGTGNGVIAAGGAHTCVTTATGTNPRCWGAGQRGQLDTYVPFSTPNPIALSPLRSPLTSLSLGDATTCFIHAGAVICVGGNDAGQAGDRSYADVFGPPQDPLPVVATHSLSVGLANTCNIIDGALFCQGDNSSGQIGDGSFLDRSTPTPVLGMASGVTDVSVASDGYVVCAVKDKQLYCWGDNTSGQLGLGITGGTFNTPQLAIAAPVVGAVTTAGDHTCAIVLSHARYNSMELQCAGSNSDGQLGNGIAGDSNNAFALAAGFTAGVTLAATSTGYTCAVQAGSLYCWGKNDAGQLGLGAAGADVPLPGTAVLANVSALTAGPRHACALAGNAKCWGDNHDGKLGDGTFTDRPAPTDVAGAIVFASLSAGGDHTCGATSSGTAYCWGANALGQLDVFPSAPVKAPGSIIAVHNPTTAIVAGGSTTCLVHAGTLACVGDNSHGQAGNGFTGGAAYDPYTPPAIQSHTTSAGGHHSCAIGRGGSPGKLLCWGDNSHGEVGNGGSLLPVLVPTSVVGMTSGVTDVSASMDSIGGYTTCAVKTGTVYCWGKNDVGQIGNGTIGPDVLVPRPVTFPRGGTAVRVTTAGDHTCALVDEGTPNAGYATYCWGSNAFGQLGLGSTGGNYVAPQLVPALGLRTIDISANTQYTCAIQNPETGASNYLYCWGHDDYGQLGNGALDADTNAPGRAIMSPTLVRNPLAISTGWGHACALASNAAYCWGINVNGQLGDNTMVQRLSPVAVDTSVMGTPIMISAGGDHTCAIHAVGGPAYCWGWDGWCQLGLGRTGVGRFSSCVADRATPAQMTGGGTIEISAGGYHTLEYHLGGTYSIAATGKNNEGEQGNATAVLNAIITTAIAPLGGW